MLSDSLVSARPQSGQNIDPSGVDAPHELQRREISGCKLVNRESRIVNCGNDFFLFTIYDSRFTALISDSMHGIEQIFALGVDTHAQLFTFATKTFL